ncbi:fucose permease [Rarobacter incanus]|uniref:Fucose permease n=2 Tax=Rarobacter incanus TaxID=153494 RepID=A0A542SNM2_9MICO|nr:fucose permease [Rarobacter incanus]
MHSHPSDPQAVARRTQRIVLAQFAIFGVAQAAWFARMPATKARFELTDSQFGTLLLVISIGALIGMVTSGAIVASIGVRKTAYLGGGLLALGMGLSGIALAQLSITILVAGFAVAGLAGALVNIPLNIAASISGKELRKENLSQFHALYSVGSVAGSAAASVSAHAGISPAAHLIGLAVPCALVIVVLARQIPPPSPTNSADAGASHGNRGPAKGALTAWREKRTLRIGVLMFCGSLSEGAANSWLALALMTGLDVSEATGALALSVFTAAMTAGRFAGPWVIGRLGRVRTVVVTGCVALMGLVGVITAPTVTLAFAGAVAWGLGAALSGPVAISAAADDPLHAPARVAMASAFGAAAQIATPPVFGALANVIGARPMLGTISIGLLATLGLSKSVAPDSRTPGMDG